jgi:putative FmdB family regulatory protein
LPIFTYQCPCGLRFGAMQPAEEPREVVACKRCGAEAARQVSASHFKFGHQPDGPQPQNTGASSIDHDLDVVIGRSAEQNLRAYQDRQDYKRRVITANDTTGDHLSRLDDGEYFVMTEQERVAAKKARLMNQDAMHKIKAWRERQGRTSGQEAAS